MSQTVEVKIGDWISRGFNRFTSQWQSWALISLVALLIIAAATMCLLIPLMLISGPLTHSLFYIFHKQQKGEVFLVGDLAYGFQNRFWDFCKVHLVLSLIGLGCYLLIIGVMLGFGALAAALHEPAVMILGVGVYIVLFITIMIGVFYLIPRLIFLVPHMYYRGLGVREAYAEVDAVIKQKYWWFVLFTIAVNFISSIGMYACYIGFIFTYPLATTIVGEAYLDLFVKPTLPEGNLDTDRTIVVSP